MNQKPFFKTNCSILVHLIAEKGWVHDAKSFLYFLAKGRTGTSSALFSAILKTKGNYRVTRKEVWNSIQTLNHSYSPNKFKTLVSRLQEKLEKYLAYKEFEQNDFQSNFARIEALNNLGFSTLAMKRMKKFKNAHESNDAYIGDWHLDKYFISVLDHNLSFLMDGEGKYESLLEDWEKGAMKNWLQALLHVYNLQKMNSGRVKVRKSHFPILSLAKAKYPNNKVIQIHLLLLKMTTELAPAPSIEVQNLIALLDSAISQNPFDKAGEEKSMILNQSEWRNLFTYTINYLNREIVTGQDHLIKQAAKIYQLFHDSGFMTLGDIIGAGHYFNFVSYRLQADVIKGSIINASELLQFSEETKKMLPEQIQDDYFLLNKANIELHQRNYSECLITLNSFNSKHSNCEGQKRWMLVKLAYLTVHRNLEEDKAEMGLIRFLSQKNKLSEKRVQTYTLMLETLKKISKAIDPSEKQRLLEKTEIPDKIFFRSIVKS